MRRLRLRQPVRVLQARVRQPLLFGTKEPVVLVPAELLRDLSPAHLEAILAHEFAHLHRQDYRANLAQIVAEILLVRHPAVLWISREIRRNRELCCDAVAARAVGSRRVVAEALAHLEQSRSGLFSLAPAATEGDLVQRVRRLLRPGVGTLRPAPSRARSLASGLALALVPLMAVPVTLPSPLPDSQFGAPPGLVLGGVDPVALLQEQQIVGTPAHERVHGGRLYRFVSAANADAFEADPQTYAVVNVAVCPVTGKPVLSDVFEIVDGRIYLFCCDRAHEIPRPTLEAIVRASRLDQLLRSGGDMR